jgi:hypothetical protein
MGTHTITHSSTKSDFSFNLMPPIQLNPNKKYEAALLSINLYNSIPNITEENNKLKYSSDEGKTWKIITLNKGCYEIEAINNEIQKVMVMNGDYDENNQEFHVSLTADISQLKSVLSITNKNYLVSFDIENSIGPTLGFKKLRPNHLHLGSNKSENIVDITKVNLVLVNVDIISGSYVNGFQSPAIYSFDPYKVPPGYKLDERPNPSLIYYPVNRLSINNLHIWLTDQNNQSVDFRGEKVTVKLHIREVSNIKEEIKRAIKELHKENIL